MNTIFAYNDKSLSARETELSNYNCRIYLKLNIIELITKYRYFEVILLCKSLVEENS